MKLILTKDEILRTVPKDGLYASFDLDEIVPLFAPETTGDFLREAFFGFSRTRTDEIIKFASKHKLAVTSLGGMISFKRVPKNELN